MVPRFHESRMSCFCVSTSVTRTLDARGIENLPFTPQESRVFLLRKSQVNQSTWTSALRRNAKRGKPGSRSSASVQRSHPAPGGQRSSDVERTCTLLGRLLAWSQQQVCVDCRFADKGLGLLRTISFGWLFGRSSLRMLDIATARTCSRGLPVIGNLIGSWTCHVEML